MKALPVTFTPYFKKVVWGGEKICKYKKIPTPFPNIGESWEISNLPGYETVVAAGPYKGWTISQLIKEFGKAFLGEKVEKKYNDTFPLLIKIIDAKENLSVQVHPDDKLAKMRHNSLGKTEMWYILQSDPGSKIFAGLKNKLSPEIFQEKVEGDFINSLSCYDSKSGDVFFLPSGQVHAIGSGNLLIEIQESSDITYRIYDYNRLDSNGKKRELHIALAKEAIDFETPFTCKLPDESGGKREIVKCPHFSISKFELRGAETLQLDSLSFEILICLEGDADLMYKEGKSKISKAQTVLFPACMEEVKIKGKGIFLKCKV